MTTLLDGKLVAEKIKKDLKYEIDLLPGRRPGLAIVQVGNNAASSVYVRNKRAACNMVGINTTLRSFSKDIGEDTLRETISELNQSETIDGILVQLPLPTHINANNILELIDPTKDVDGFHPYNVGRLSNRNPALRPCTPYGIIKLLDHYKIELKGLNAVIVGCSNHVGRPMGLELLMAGCTVTTCHRFTKDLDKKISQADLLVVAIGNPNVIKTSSMKEGAIVVDVGINKVDDKLIGDIHFETAKEKASYITPVPGGVGPMTVSTLLCNTLLSRLNRGY